MRMRHCRLYRCMSLLVLARMLAASGSDPGTAVPHAQAAEQVVVRLQPSSNVCPTQELRLPLTAASVMLRPAMFNNWQEVFQQHPDALDYLLTPGDYTSWGPLILKNRSGIPTRKRTIRYYDPETEHLHPVHREKEARIDAIDAWGTTSHWLFHGLTIRQPSTATKL